MTQEEEDLDEELKNLGIQEDFGDDSDATPINSPIPNLHLEFPLYSNTAQSNFFDLDLGRFSLFDDYDACSESSLSWGEDEFEGEATKIVTNLFEELDHLLYKTSDVNSLNIFFPSIPVERAHLLLETNERKPSTNQLNIAGTIGLGSIVKETAHVSKTIPNEVSYPHKEKHLFDEEYSEFEASSAFVEECNVWVEHFPHYRIRGKMVNGEQMNQLDHYIQSSLGAPDYQNQSDVEEEFLASDGSYEHLLPLVSMKRVGTSLGEKKKAAKSQSRICSGSNDPETLTELVLLNLFNSVWPEVANEIQPLFYVYLKKKMGQSVNYPYPHDFAVHGGNFNVFSDARNNINFEGSKIIENSFQGKQSWSVPRPLSGLSRQSSASFRLPNYVPSIKVLEKVNELKFDVRNVPLYKGPHVATVSSSSINTSGSNNSKDLGVSLPSLNLRRPVSSQLSQRPLPSSLVLESRPSSNTLHSKPRVNRSHEPRLSTTFEKDRDSPQNSPLDLSSSWSRYENFLPPIRDSSPHPLHRTRLTSIDSLSSSSKSPATSAKTIRSATYRFFKEPSDPAITDQRLGSGRTWNKFL